MRFGLSVVLALAACGASNVKRAGESCVASSECDKALLCNLSTHVCAGMGSPDAGVDPVDAAMPTDARPLDAFVFKDAPPDAFVFLDAPP
jgi:hypothetical protein